MARSSADVADVTMHAMTTKLSRLRRTITSLPAESRPEFKRIDASSARYDDGAWLKDA